MGIKGSMLIETSILIIAVVVALVFMSTYIRRAVQGKIRESGEEIGQRYEYSGKTISNSITNLSRNVLVNVFSIDPEDRTMRTETIIRKDDSQGWSNEVVN